MAVKPEAVINLAWYVEHGKFWTADENITWLSTSLQLARLSVGAGVRRFIGIGTCYEYDWPDDKSCTEEVTPTASHTLYDTTKDSCHRTLSSFFSQNDTDFVWARVFFPYGPSEPSGRLVASVARALINGERARCSSGSAVRDFVEVRDVGEAMRRRLHLIEYPGSCRTGRPPGSGRGTALYCCRHNEALCHNRISPAHRFGQRPAVCT